MNPYGGRGGFGRGRGFHGGGRGFARGRRGWRHQYWATGLPFWARYGQGNTLAPPPPNVEREALRAQAEDLAAQLEEIRKRLAELQPEEAGKGAPASS